MTNSLRLELACAIGQVAGGVSRALKRGRGDTLTGRVILALDKNALSKLASQRDLVLVSGTNGKTTSTANLAKILEQYAHEGVSTSGSGANMPAGIVAALASKPRNRFAAIEVDEMYLPQIFRQTKPKVVVLLNLSRDQLHRTGEVRKVSQLWNDTFATDDVSLVIDRDDPFLEYSAAQAGHVIRIGFGGRKHPDAATCPKCAAILDWSTGDYSCVCGLGTKLPDVRADKRLRGPQRNSTLVIEAARLMGAEINAQEAQELISQSPDRITEFEAANRKIPTHLAKNPESWREALAQITKQSVILSVNARGIDGRDTSWLWDIDYSSLQGKQVVCTGDRKLDVAYRLSVQGIDVVLANDFESAAATCATSQIQAIASYTAFQDLAAQALGIAATQGGHV